MIVAASTARTSRNVSENTGTYPAEMVMTWSETYLETYFAPDLSAFTAADVPKVENADEVHRYWVTHYFLNSVLRGGFEAGARQQMYTFLRRSQSAVTEYTAARDATLAFLSDRQRLGQYADAVGHWEAFLGYAWQAYRSLGQGNNPSGPDADPALERLRRMHNWSKHADEKIVDREFVANTLFLVWLGNEGLRSAHGSITFDDLGRVVNDLIEWAEVLEDPRTAPEKLKRLFVEES